MLQFLHIVDAENIAILRKAVALGICFAQRYFRQFIISLHIVAQKHLDLCLSPHQIDGADAGLVASLHAYIQWLDTPHRDGMLAGIGSKGKLIHICLAEIIGILHAIDIGIDHHLTIKLSINQIQSVYQDRTCYIINIGGGSRNQFHVFQSSDAFSILGIKHNMKLVQIDGTLPCLPLLFFVSVCPCFGGCCSRWHIKPEHHPDRAWLRRRFIIAA